MECIINEAMSGHARQAFEAWADDTHGEVSALARAGMAGVQMAVVLDLDELGFQHVQELLPNVGGGDAHGLVSPTASGSMCWLA